MMAYVTLFGVRGVNLTSLTPTQILGMYILHTSYIRRVSRPYNPAMRCTAPIHWNHKRAALSATRTILLCRRTWLYQQIVWSVASELSTHSLHNWS